MKSRLPYIIVSIISLIVGFAIFYSKIPFVRYSLGDYVVVIFLYNLIKAVQPKVSSLKLVTGILIYSIAIEVLQLFDFPDLFGTEKVWVQVILGSEFSISDILAYFLGVVTAYWLDIDFLQSFT